MAELADATDFNNLSTWVGNSQREFSQTRGTLSTLWWWQSRAKLFASDIIYPKRKTMPRKRKYSDEELINAVKNNQSIRAVLQEIGLTPAGGNYESIKKYIKKLDIDTSHFLGQAILKGKTHSYGTRPLEKVLIHKKLENTWRLKRRLLKEGVKEYRCEKCQESTWLGKPIPLELHHKDGYRKNNTLQNIELLCPNCHALTDNYRGSKKKV